MSNPLNKRLRGDKSVGFASGEVVFEKEGSGKGPQVSGWASELYAAAINRRFEHCYESRT